MYSRKIFGETICVWVIGKEKLKTVVACCGFPSSGSLGSSRKDLAYCSLAVGQKIFEEEKPLLLLLLYPRRYKRKPEEEEMVALTSRRRALIFNVYLPQIPHSSSSFFLKKKKNKRLSTRRNIIVDCIDNHYFGLYFFFLKNKKILFLFSIQLVEITGFSFFFFFPLARSCCCYTRLISPPFAPALCSLCNHFISFNSSPFPKLWIGGCT